MSGLGVVASLPLAGIVTGTLRWRWVIFINIPVGQLVLAGNRSLVDAARHQGRLDGLPTITRTVGMASLVCAVTRGGEQGWTDPLTLGAFAGAAVLIPQFLLSQARNANPLLPLELFRDRNHTGSYLSTLLLAVSPMGSFSRVTLLKQHILGYSPIRTGLAWLGTLQSSRLQKPKYPPSSNSRAETLSADSAVIEHIRRFA